MFRLCAGLLVLAALQLGGCGGLPVQPTDSTSPDSGPTVPPVQAEITRHARTMIGKPYRYGGTTPQGFDCSGLVYFSYRQAGVPVPRTTQEQFKLSRRVGRTELEPGDLVFFRLNKPHISHVGLYLGNDEFIHAPSTGKHVTLSTLNDPYWRSRLVHSGRILAPQDDGPDLATRGGDGRSGSGRPGMD